MTGIPSATRKRQRPEEALQMQVVGYLRWALDGNSAFMHVPNGGLRSLTEAIRFKKMGVTPGAPDLLVINDGRAIWLELKVDNGQLTPAQIECHDRLRRARCVVATCRSLDEVAEVLKRAGVPLRTESLTTERIKRGFAAGAE